MAVIEGESRRYLEGNFGPVAEELTVTDLDVTGALPPELSGRYLRIGPNPWPIPEGPYHWFTGDGMVHGVELRDGRATWSLRKRRADPPEVPFRGVDGRHHAYADAPSPLFWCR